MDGTGGFKDPNLRTWWRGPEKCLKNWSHNNVGGYTDRKGDHDLTKYKGWLSKLMLNNLTSMTSSHHIKLHVSK